MFTHVTNILQTALFSTLSTMKYHFLPPSYKYVETQPHEPLDDAFESNNTTNLYAVEAGMVLAPYIPKIFDLSYHCTDSIAPVAPQC